MHRAPQPYRTLDAKPNDVSIVKPGELVDVVEMTPLTLNDRRIYNLLLAAAWAEIDQPREHVIPKRDLQGTLHKGSDRVEDSLRRLMTAIVCVRLQRDGRWETQQVQLLGSNTTPDASDGMIRYDFHPKLRKIVCESRIFARLHREIMFALSSKYSLALYEMIQKRGNLQTKNVEEFSIDDLRGLLGVPEGKLTTWINLKNKAITPAVKEVSDLSDFLVVIEPIKGKAKQFTGVRMQWERKDTAELQKVERELEFSKVGRKARLNGRAEPPVPFGAAASAGREQIALQPETFIKGRKLCPGHDIYVVEQEWRDWASGKERPVNADAAFLAFCKAYAARHPINH